MKLDCTSPRAVFADLVAGALTELGTHPSPLAVAYLIGLLHLQIRTPEVHVRDRARAPTLAVELLSAVSEGGSTERSRLRELGDQALFVSGFFGQSLKDPDVGLKYYREVGCTAYRRLSVQLAHSADDDGPPELFEELADEFGVFVELLAQVGSRTRPTTPMDLLRTYGRYVETGSSKDRAQLVRQGVVPLSPEALRKWQ